MNLNKLGIESLTKQVKVFVLGVLIGASIVYANMNYIHDSSVGGFVFKNDKVYNLCEIDGLDVKLGVKK